MSASDDLLFLAQRFEGVISLIPTLQKVESLNNHQKELQSTVNVLQKTVEDLNEQVLSKKLILEEVQDKTKNMLNDIKTHEGKLAALQKHLAELKSKF